MLAASWNIRSTNSLSDFLLKKTDLSAPFSQKICLYQQKIKKKGCSVWYIKRFSLYCVFRFCFLPGKGTYTGEDMLELSCHGGSRTVARIL